ncbi:queuosine precursor transporter [Desulfovibrio inopinatus]|uniref:queuosine precursor transporter n=1 Tax=Desulfovibrio inopinatus TaxID=102109 RepID=UPI00041A483A|nr:queuosine precursor transporter [Desulfovibrio inopinatus]
MKQFRYLDIITVFFVSVLLISNIASTKILELGSFTFDGGTILFPLSYIFGDILTEVYGYGRSRRVIWLGFFSAFLMSTVLMIVGALPPAADWPHQSAYETILGLTPRIVIASLVAYFLGEFVNSYAMARLKIVSKGKFLWVRTIGSTIAGEFVDTVIFVVIAFWGVFSTDLLITIIISNYIFKTMVEILFTPLTYLIVGFLKNAEREDYYDYNTSFNPFRMDVGV